MKTLYVYPWDLQDEEPGEVIRNAQMGRINMLSMASIYHTGRFLLPHNPRQKVYIPEDGVIYFSPRKGKYSKRIPRAGVLARKNILGKTINLLREKGMKSRSWVVCLHNSNLGRKNRGWTIENAFGDNNFTSLCPANQEVLTYFQEIFRDLLEQYQFDWVELESFEYAKFQHGYHHEKTGIFLDDMDSFLLSLCFCPSCREKMKAWGVDTEAIREQVKKMLDKRFADPRVRNEKEVQTQLAVFKEENRRFIEGRQSIVSEFVEKIVDSVRAVSDTKVLLLYRYNYSQAWLSGIDPQKLAKTIDRWMVQGYFERTEKIKERLLPFLTAFPVNQLEVGLNVCYPFVKEKEDIKEDIATLDHLGINNLSFYNYGFIPLRNLE